MRPWAHSTVSRPLLLERRRCTLDGAGRFAPLLSRMLSDARPPAIRVESVKGRRSMLKGRSSAMA